MRSPGDLAVVRRDGAAARLEARARPRGRRPGVLEGLLVERGLREGVRAVRPAGALDRRPDRPARPARPSRSTRKRRRTSTTRSRCARRRTGCAPGCTSPTSRTSSPAGSPLDRGAAARAFSTYVPGGVAPMLPPELADDLCSLRPQRRPAVRDGRVSAGAASRSSTARSSAAARGSPTRRRSVGEAEPGGRGGAAARRRAHARSCGASASTRGALRIESTEIQFALRRPRRRRSAPGGRASRTRTCWSRS